MLLPAMLSGWTSEWTEAIASVATAILTLLTTIVAVLVYLEAKAIRKTEWFAKSSENWQSFNRLVVDADYAARWSDIIKGRLVWADLNQRDLMFIYSFLNVLIFEFNAGRAHLLDRHYAQKSVSDNILYFRHVWPQLREHLQEDGWLSDFLPAADAAIGAAEIEKKDAARRKPALGPSARQKEP